MCHHSFGICYVSEVSELVPDLFEKDKALACYRLGTASHCVDQTCSQAASRASRRGGIRGAFRKGLSSVILHPYVSKLRAIEGIAEMPSSSHLMSEIF